VFTYRSSCSSCSEGGSRIGGEHEKANDWRPRYGWRWAWLFLGSAVVGGAGAGAAVAGGAPRVPAAVAVRVVGFLGVAAAALLLLL
jgi:hypothetical protein